MTLNLKTHNPKLVTLNPTPDSQTPNPYRCTSKPELGGNDLAVKLWDTETGALLRDFMQHTEPVTAMAWSEPQTLHPKLETPALNPKP
jgi:WD40 repeat protein